MFLSDQGDRGVLSRRNPTAQGEGDNGDQRARSAQERGKRRGTVGRRARGKGRETRNHPDAKGQRRGSAQARGQRLARSVEKQLRDLQSAQQK